MADLIKFPANSDALALLRTLATRTAEHAADPQVVAHPDQELLDLCEVITTLRLRELELTERWHRVNVRDTENFRRARDDADSARRAVRRPLLRASKRRATTAAGIYAKAVAVHHIGVTATELGKSLAEDILACGELRRILWSTAIVPE